MCNVEKNDLILSKIPEEEAMSFAAQFDTQNSIVVSNLGLEKNLTPGNKKRGERVRKNGRLVITNPRLELKYN